MKKILIQRLSSNDNQTEGLLRLYDEDEKMIFHCKTLELPWLKNQKRISCIPALEYLGIKHISPNFGNSIWIRVVPNRSEILIHFGNYVGSKNPITGRSDSKGCILVGSKFLDLDGDGIYEVPESKKTMEHLYELCSDNVEVVIQNRTGKLML